jgi:hypothetical protein
MVDVDTLLTTLYVLVDTYDKAQAATPQAQAERALAAQLSSLPPGRPPKLSPSEVVTLALFAQWGQFRSERAFYRYAQRHLRPAFPTLPDRSQYNRALRRQYPLLVAVAWHLAALLEAAASAYQVMDTTGVPTRQYKRRACGWLPSAAGIGYCNRVGWFEGLRLLTCATQEGVLTGFALGEAPRKDQPLADAFLSARASPPLDAQLNRLDCVGAWYGGYYAVDTGFEGRALHQHWRQDLDAQVVCMPNRSRPSGWPRRLRQWFAGVRQIAETVHARLMDTFGLTQDRPHTLEGFQVRLAAKIALYNGCCWLNRQLGRPLLAFADLLDW